MRSASRSVLMSPFPPHRTSPCGFFGRPFERLVQHASGSGAGIPGTGGGPLLPPRPRVVVVVVPSGRARMRRVPRARRPTAVRTQPFSTRNTAHTL